MGGSFEYNPVPYLSPMAPNIRENIILARYGNEDRVPVDVRLNPRALDTNFGAAVITKYRPQLLP